MHRRPPNYQKPEIRYAGHALVHIEDLFIAFQEFAQESLKAQQFSRSPKTATEIMDAARDKFKAFCDRHHLPIDWTNRT